MEEKSPAEDKDGSVMERPFSVPKAFGEGRGGEGRGGGGGGYSGLENFKT